jgi:cystathionine beta-lyase family protein involved in aluminum resistance
MMPQLISFCEAVQKRSPVGAYIRPIPGMSPGYGDEVIFADGTFVDGSTLELSADGPLREPFVAFTQVRTYVRFDVFSSRFLPYFLWHIFYFTF